MMRVLAKLRHNHRRHNSLIYRITSGDTERQFGAAAVACLLSKGR